MCPPDDPAWDVYKKASCMGINQCERTGTAARAAKYQPQNISELCAFIAAIRPGFKSMYKKFESNSRFPMGKSFDDLIQTRRCQNPAYCIRAGTGGLNYAGISMSECYTAIKNIAKKRKRKCLPTESSLSPGFSPLW